MCAFSCPMPMGRQFASGLSLLLSATRFLTNSAAHGRYGAPPCVFAPMFPNAPPTDGTDVGQGPRNGAGCAADAAEPDPRCPVAPGAAAPPRPRPNGISQTPERSGLPFARRGGGASKFGLPSAPIGTPDAVYFGHCACGVAVAAASPPSTRAACVSSLSFPTVNPLSICLFQKTIQPSPL